MTIGEKIAMRCRHAFKGWFKPMPKVGWLYTIREQRVITKQHGDTFLAYKLVGIEGREVNGAKEGMARTRCSGEGRKTL